MESYMFTNGLPVLFYCENRVLFKIRNLSKAMRKRANFIFKNKKITVKTHQKNIRNLLEFEIYLVKNNLKLDSEYFTKHYMLIEQQERIVEALYPNQDKNRGFSSSNQKEKRLVEVVKETPEINELTSQFNSFNLFSQEFIQNSSIRLNYINLFCFNSLTSFFLATTVIGYADVIKIDSFIEENEIVLLNRVYKVNELELFETFIDLTGINWINSLQILTLYRVSVQKEIILPSLRKLVIRWSCKGFSKIVCPRLESMHLANNHFTCEEIKAFKNLKILFVTFCNSEEVFNNLPPNLRCIRLIEETLTRFDYLDTKRVLDQCPKLIELIVIPNFSFKLVDLIGANLRKVNIDWDPAFSGKFTLKLRKVEIQDDNYSFITEHPEIISKVNQITINTKKFDLRRLPDHPMKITFDEEIFIENKEIERCCDKLKNYHLESITVDKLETARKVLKFARKVDLIFCLENVHKAKNEFESEGCQIKDSIHFASRKDNCCIF